MAARPGVALEAHTLTATGFAVGGAQFFPPRAAPWAGCTLAFLFSEILDSGSAAGVWPVGQTLRIQRVKPIGALLL